MGRPKGSGKAAKVKKVFIEDDDLEVMANEVIQEHKMDYLNNVKIKYVLVHPYISKTVAGKCIKANAELKHWSGAEYVIEFSENVWEALKEDVRKILMLHELKHILLTTNDKTGEFQYKILPHDVADFLSIIEKYGVDWINTIRVTSASLFDLDADQQDKIKI